MKHNLKIHFKFLSVCALKVFICSIIGILLLVIVYLIPTQNIEKNVSESAKHFFDYSAFKWCIGENSDNLTLDNFTDALILLETSYNAKSDKSSILQNAVSVKNSTISNSYSNRATLLSHYLENVKFDDTETYPRYWHGYLIFTKFLFLFINYTDFRLLNFVIQSMLFLFLIILFIKRKMIYCVLPYTISYLFLKPVELFLSMQYSSCYYVYTISCIVLLLFGKNITEKQLCTLFLYTGVSLAYFDFLTYPIATFGMPAVIYFSMIETKNLKKSFSKLFGILVCWGFGYAFMWFLKWLWASIILKRNIFFDAYDNIIYRTIHDSYSKLETLKNNLENFFNTPLTLVFVIYLIVELFFVVYTFLKSDRKRKNIIHTIFPFIFLFTLPLLWYCAVTNHSAIHSWFTYRTLIVSAFAIMCLMSKLIFELKNQKYLEQTSELV